MSTPEADRPRLYEEVLEDLHKAIEDAKWWAEQAAYHQSRSGECAQIEAMVCQREAEKYQNQAQLLGDVILSIQYPHLELPDAV